MHWLPKVMCDAMSSEEMTGAGAGTLQDSAVPQLLSLRGRHARHLQVLCNVICQFIMPMRGKTSPADEK